VIGKRAELAGGHGNTLCLGPEIGNSERTIGAGLAAPPVEAQGVVLRECRPDEASGKQRGAAHQEFTSVGTNSHGILPCGRCLPVFPARSRRISSAK
jgi:hypothetical protein